MKKCSGFFAFAEILPNPATLLPVLKPSSPADTHTFSPAGRDLYTFFACCPSFSFFCFSPCFLFQNVSLTVEVKSSLCPHKVHVMKDFCCILTNSTQKIANWPGFPLLCTSHFLNVPIPGCANLVARPFEGLLLPS